MRECARLLTQEPLHSVVSDETHTPIRKMLLHLIGAKCRCAASRTQVCVIQKDRQVPPEGPHWRLAGIGKTPFRNSTTAPTISGGSLKARIVRARGGSCLTRIQLNPPANQLTLVVDKQSFAKSRTGVTNFGGQAHASLRANDARVTFA